MSADDLAALDLDPIRARLEPIDRDFWRDACAPMVGDATFPADRVFVQNAPDDIAALLAEVERLRAENSALREQLGADVVKEWADGRAE